MSFVTRLSLIDEVKASPDGEAWTTFSSIYRELVFRWLRQQDVQHADAEDVCQEVMAVVIREIGGFDHNGRRGAFRCWLRRVTANRMRQLWQRKSTHQRSESPVDLAAIAEGLIDDSSRLSVVWDRQHDDFVLTKLLRRLSGKFAPTSIECFVRIAVDQQPASEVAESLGMTVGAARVAQHRVLQTLKKDAEKLLD